MRWAAALVLIASLRIVSTFYLLSHTTDEPAHLAAGLQYLETGKYTYEDQHPPLARVLGAVGLHLAGVRHRSEPDMYVEGWHLLGQNGRYRHNLFFARLAMLPLFWLACFVVFRWTCRVADERAAIFAVGVFTMLPAVLGHAGLVTTDFALTAFTCAAMWASVELKQSPTWKWAAILGLFAGLALLSKFSALLFLPIALQWNRRSVRYLPVAAALAAFVVCAGYLFHPAPFTSGVQSVWGHHLEGHPAFLFGHVSRTGFWYYYPVIILFKTPLAVLILAAVSRQWKLLLTAAAIVAFSMPSHINIGIRHILPIFVPLAMCAGIAASRLRRPMMYALLGWAAIASLAVHPDYIAYTNELALGHPENILADSDLDWEQGMSRLNKRLHELQVSRIHLKITTPGYLMSNAFVPFDFIPDGDTPPHGWSAIGITPWRIDSQPRWAARYQPRERVAHSILLYWFP